MLINRVCDGQVSLVKNKQNQNKRHLGKRVCVCENMLRRKREWVLRTTDAGAILLPRNLRKRQFLFEPFFSTQQPLVAL